MKTRAIRSTIFAGLALGISQAWAQAPVDSLDSAWVAACAGAPADSAFASQCDSILNEGPGSGGRRSDAAIGNNLDTFAALAGNTTVSLDEVEEQVEASSSYGPWSLFFGARFASTERDTTDLENGFDTDTNSINGGFSYQSSTNLALSANIDVNRSDTDFAENAGSLDNDSWSITGIVDWNNQSNMYANAYLGAASMDIESVRNIAYSLVTQAGTVDEGTITVSTTATGSTDGDQFNGGAVIGWLFDNDGFNLDLSAGYHFSNTDIDAYVEQGGDGLAQRVSGQSFDSSILRLTGSVQRAISTDWGVLLPHFRVAFSHEGDQDSRLLSSSFADDSGQFLIQYQTDDPDRDYYEIGVGVSAIFSGGNVVFLDYRSLAGHEFLDDDVFSIGARIQL